MKKLILLLLAIPAITSAQDHYGRFSTLLKGTVTGYDDMDLVVLSQLDDYRFMDKKHIIEVVDGHFEYLLEGDDVIGYELAIREDIERGGWQPMPFFPDSNVVEFELWRDEDSGEVKYKVSGGVLNQALVRYREEHDTKFKAILEPLDAMDEKLWDEDKHSSEAAKEIYAKMDSAATVEERSALYSELDNLRKTNAHLSPEAKEISDKYDEVLQDVNRWKYGYIMDNTDLYSFSMMVSDMIYGKERINTSLFEPALEVMSMKFSGHPYVEFVQNGYNSLEALKPGKSFIDFTAPDLAGKEHMLSENLDGKIAVIDLWASWCGPCRGKSKLIIPVYEKYKDRGFTVVGIAREFKSPKDLEKAIEMDGYPWLNLVELDNANKIWEKYGIVTAAGMVVLVDADGMVVAVNPTVEEIEDYLERNLNS